MRLLLFIIAILTLYYFGKMKVNNQQIDSNPIEGKKELRRKKIENIMKLIVCFFFLNYLVMFMNAFITDILKILGYNLNYEFEMQKKVADIIAFIIILLRYKRICNDEEQ